MSDKVLIVDDDPSICKLLEKVMKSNDLEPTIATCGKDALSLLRTHTFDLILMDVMLGDMEGFDVIKKLRNQGINTPVMIVSGRNEDYDSLYGLSLGADDFITKPFRPLVLGAKAKALIRRNKNLVLEGNQMLESGPFSYDTATMRFYKNGEELILSSKESALLLLFMKHPQQVFTKDMIYEHVWGNTIAVDDNAIMVYIACAARLKMTVRIRSISLHFADLDTALYLNEFSCFLKPEKSKQMAACSDFFGFTTYILSSDRKFQKRLWHKHLRYVENVYSSVSGDLTIE